MVVANRVAIAILIKREEGTSNREQRTNWDLSLADLLSYF